MSRKNKPDTATGVLVVNKHEGVTSHRIVQILRRLYDTARVGHTGTLDPMATGVLPILLGRAVKASDYLVSEEKEYIATLRLGVTTDTLDTTGEILSTSDNIPKEAAVLEAAKSFIGEIEQIPPMYSAIKIDGQKLVDLARAGETVERKPRQVEIKELDVEKLSENEYKLRIVCSKGTYVRTLCADIGEKLGCGGAMSSLVRVRTGNFTLENAVTVEELENMTFEQRVALPLPTVKLFEDLNTISVNDFYAKLIRGGTELYQKKLGTNFEDGELIRIMYNGEFLALGRVCEFEKGSAVKPEKLFIL
ncbi:MAG: tRNA pseudouridine(55) synthase TruB [Clostridia bacterium]|nr:tRNA pseudouridine(55) synthase TruB [Clostridia bacterium]